MKNHNKICLCLFCGLILIAALISTEIEAAEIRLISKVEVPESGSYFEVVIVTSELNNIRGMDLRLQFDQQAVAVDTIFSEGIFRFQWSGQQSDPELGFAVTGITFSKTGQFLHFEADDTVAAIKFLRLSTDRTIISLKPNYPVLVDSDLNVVSCTVMPLILESVTSVENQDGNSIIKLLEVNNYPNPFNLETQFVISFKGSIHWAKLYVFDMLGRCVWAREFMVSEGANYLKWRGIDYRGQPLCSGLYFYRITVDENIVQGKCVIIR